MHNRKRKENRMEKAIVQHPPPPSPPHSMHPHIAGIKVLQIQIPDPRLRGRFLSWLAMGYLRRGSKNTVHHTPPLTLSLFSIFHLPLVVVRSKGLVVSILSACGPTMVVSCLILSGEKK
ncbi:hypothetical protein DFH27DRAFT_24392 [Peziza echinospora]|nr:hypothetical protein DFH27DRAFT_24392 [Peziza echinospora]